MQQPEYSVQLKINGQAIKRVIIDQHYQVKHSDLSDFLILALVKQLNGQDFQIEMTKGEFNYFRAEPVIFNHKPYRLIFLLCTTDDFLGVVNAFRIKG